MAHITIKDLLQSDDLDREAMKLIVGGGSSAAPYPSVDKVEAGSGRVVEYPPGFSRLKPSTPAKS